MGLRELHPDWAPERRAAYWLVFTLNYFEKEGAPRDHDSAALTEVWQLYDKLAAFYQPHGQLPNRGQRLWRQFSHALETPEVERLELLCVLDEFRQWLVDYYWLGTKSDDDSVEASQGVIGQGPNASPPPAPSRRTKRAEDDVLLLQMALIKHHGLYEGTPHFTPATQKQLGELLDWPQSKVSRVMGRLFGADGMKGYHQACRRKKLPGLRKTVEDVDRVDGIVQPPDETDEE